MVKYLRLFQAVFPVALLVMLLPGSLVEAAGPAASVELEKAVGREDFVEAKKLADSILQNGTQEDRQRALSLYGRILLASKDKETARRYLEAAGKANQGVSVDPQLLAIYRAWLAALDNKRDSAIATLEKMLSEAGESPSEVLAEAADIVAVLHLESGDTEKS